MGAWEAISDELKIGFKEGQQTGLKVQTLPALIDALWFHS
jgi:hypothetical protein